MGNEKVDAVLANLETAPIDEPLRATLAFLRKVTRDHAGVTAADVEVLLGHGLSKAKIKDALDVAFCFNVITRLADTFKFEVGPQASFDASAKALLSRGYKL